MRSLMMALCAAAAACAAGCGGGYTIDDGPLSGKIGGQEWTVKSAWTDDFLSDDKSFFTTLYDVDADACSFPTNVTTEILINVPKEPGEYEMSFSQNATFVDGKGENYLATIGRIVVEDVTDTEIDVGLYAIYGNDDSYEVSGHFKATICPPSP